MTNNSGLGKMHLDLYTQNSGLTHKAKFWCNYVSALKGDGLMVKNEPIWSGGHVPIWRVFKPTDFGLYDLLYPEETWPRAQDLRARDDPLAVREIHPSIVNTLPDDFPELKSQFAKLESQMFDRPRRRATEPLTPVIPDAHDRIFTSGYHYDPVHTEIYGTYLPKPIRRY